MIVTVIASSMINIISATRIIFTQGIGKNGATVAVSTKQQACTTYLCLHCMCLFYWDCNCQHCLFAFCFHVICVQDTSVLSPVIPMAFFVSMTVYYALYSPAMMLENHSVIFFVAMVAPIVKFVLLMMVCEVVSPVSLTDGVLSAIASHTDCWNVQDTVTSFRCHHAWPFGCRHQPCHWMSYLRVLSTPCLVCKLLYYIRVHLRFIKVFITYEKKIIQM